MSIRCWLCTHQSVRSTICTDAWDWFSCLWVCTRASLYVFDSLIMHAFERAILRSVLVQESKLLCLLVSGNVPLYLYKVFCSAMKRTFLCISECPEAQMLRSFTVHAKIQNHRLHLVAASTKVQSSDTEASLCFTRQQRVTHIAWLQQWFCGPALRRLPGSQENHTVQKEWPDQV